MENSPAKQDTGVANMVPKIKNDFIFIKFQESINFLNFSISKKFDLFSVHHNT